MIDRLIDFVIIKIRKYRHMAKGRKAIHSPPSHSLPKPYDLTNAPHTTSLLLRIRPKELSWTRNLLIIANAIF